MNHKLITEFSAIKNVEAKSDGLLRLPLLALAERVIFPQVLSLVPIDTEAHFQAVRYAQRHQQTLLLVKLRPGRDDEQSPRGIHEIGTEIAPGQFSDANASFAQPPGGSEKFFRSQTKSLAHASSERRGIPAQVLVQGRRRVQIMAVDETAPFPIAQAMPLEENLDNTERVEALSLSLLEQLNQLSPHLENVPDAVINFLLAVQEPGHFCDALAAILPLEAEQLQALLEECDLAKRLEQLSIASGGLLKDFHLRETWHNQLQDDFAATQREMYLREQLRIIQQELGDGDIFQQELRELAEKIQNANLPKEINLKAMKEMSRLDVVQPMSPEYGVIRTYLDRLLNLPWQSTSEENLDLRHAQDTLDSAHYGLEKVKTRIIEHIAVRQLARDKMKSPILCFLGPPGVGKTSLGKSIADAIGCKFLRISLGGIRDEAEIRGHRRTYIGSMPGRILQQMERAETVNPVFMLDEIDKMGADFRGDPTAALLEVLDPEQNQHFVDHYFEVAYDLSKVTFITTANDLYGVPEALIDRLEVIEFKGYTEEEKIEIARRFLMPKQLQANGIADLGVSFSLPALQHIIRHFTYESGVRNLEREIANICRKIARQRASGRSHPRRISPAIAEKLLGPPQVLDSRVNRADAIGIVSGLVWTPNGGDIQTIEVSLAPGKGNLMLTGQLGDVLQESAQIALSYLRSRARDFALPDEDFDNYDIHVHLPEGAVHKDGPSAGISLAAALVSAFRECPARCDYAMTGEITLRGHVLAVGGVEEKVLAARRRKVPRVILPKDNQKDLRDLPKSVKKDVSVVFVEDLQEALDLILRAPPPRRQRDIDAEKRQRDYPENAG